MNRLFAIIALSLVVFGVVGCTQDPIILRKICSKNGTYCEDDMRTAGVNGVVWENISTVTDSRSPNNQTLWENLT